MHVFPHEASAEPFLLLEHLEWKEWIGHYFDKQLNIVSLDLLLVFVMYDSQWNIFTVGSTKQDI